MKINHFYDEATSTLTYVAWDAETRDAVVIDPVLNYDPLTSSTSTESLERIAEFVKQNNLRVHWSLETHVHADHLTGSQYLRRHFGAKTAISTAITKVQSTFKHLFNLPEEFRADGNQFDHLLADGEMLQAGSLSIEALHTPGHTPACITFHIDDALFTGDALFIEDTGTGRCDFPEGSATDMYDSVHEQLYNFPDDTRVFVGHDYQPGGRALRFETTIGASKSDNIRLKAATDRDAFIQFRGERDRGLKPPRLLYQSLQVNMEAGRLPGDKRTSLRFLTIPLNASAPTDAVGERA